MKLNSERGMIVIEELYNGLLMRTAEGNEIGICMRDDTFEINVIPKAGADDPHYWNWFRVNMQQGTIERL